MRRFRWLGLIWLSLLLLTSVAAAGEQSRFFNPQTMMPLDEIHRGMRGTLKSVYQGTTIQECNVEILGVVQKFSLGEDIVLARILDGPVVERKSGVIGGMSGSPVYINGRLVGALAFSWAFVTEPIFGITPIGSMFRAWENDDAMAQGTSASHPDPGVRLAGRWITQAQVTPCPSAPFVDEHTIALRPVSPVLLCSGFSPEKLGILGKILEPYGLQPMAGPGALRDPVEVTLEPGASVGVQLCSGSFDISGVGTVTYREGDRLLAFGHPLLKAGKVDFPLTTAWIHDIVPALDSSNKLGSVMAPVGTLVQDTPWSVAGRLGGTPEKVPVQVQVTDADTGITRRYAFQVIQHDALTPMLVMIGTVASLDAGYDPGPCGMIRSTVTLEGTKGAKVTRRNTAYFEGAPVNELARSILEVVALYRYNIYEPQGLRAARVEVNLTRRDETAVIERVYSEQAIGKAGEPLPIHVVIRPWGGEPVDKRVVLDLPADLPATTLEVGAAGGALAGSLRSHLGLLTPDYDSLSGVLEEMERQEDSTELLVLAAGKEKGMAVGGVRLPRLPQSVQTLLSSTVPLYLSEGYAEIGAKLKTEWSLYGGALLEVPVENRRGERPTTTRHEEGGNGEETENGEEGGPPAPPVPPSGGKSVLRWPGKPIGQQPFLLPEYPPRSLAWAASALRTDIARLVHQDSGEAAAAGKPSGEPSAEHTASGEPPEGEAAGGKRKKRPAKSAEEKAEPEEKKAEEEGVGRVLRQPSEWVQAEADDFAEGETRGTGLASEGGLLLVPAWKQTAALPDKTLFAAACAPDGTLYFSSDRGNLYRLQGDKPQLIYRSRDFALTALAVQADGTVLAGSTTSGTLLRVSPQGEAQTLAQLPVLYIWAILPAPDGSWYVGTGPQGVIFQVQPSGDFRQFVRLPVGHVLDLAWRGEQLIAATAQEGAVYLLSKDGTASLALGALGEDITSLAVDRDGNVYAGVAPGGKVFRLEKNGEFRVVYEDSDNAVYSLLATPEGVLVGTAQEGKIFLIRDPQHTSTVLVESPADFITRLVATPDGQAYALANGPGGIMTSSLNGPREGLYLSSVLDAKRLAKWGRVTWLADLAGGASLEIQCRSGNTEDPQDGSWSAWSRPLGNGEVISVPPARCLQYRVRLQAPTAQATALLRRLAFSYLPANQAPTLEVSKPGPADIVHGKVKISWTASDEDDDALATIVYLRPAGGPWKKLAGPTKDTEYEWDTEGLEPGRYDLRLVVSDQRSNPVGWLEGEALVQGLLVDNDAPNLVVMLADSDHPTTSDVKGAAVDGGSGIVSVAWKRADDDNGSEAEWFAAAPVELVFRNPVISFLIPREQIPTGVQAIIVRAIDAAGNYKDQEIQIPGQQAAGEGEAAPETTEAQG